MMDPRFILLGVTLMALAVVSFLFILKELRMPGSYDPYGVTGIAFFLPIFLLGGGVFLLYGGLTGDWNFQLLNLWSEKLIFNKVVQISFGIFLVGLGISFGVTSFFFDRRYPSPLSGMGYMFALMPLAAGIFLLYCSMKGKWSLN